MDIKSCPLCRTEHFEDYDLCRWCMDDKQRELEQRLRIDDGKATLAVISARALHGSVPTPRRRWWVQ